MSAWKIKRDDTEFTAPDVATLRKWAAQGRVLPTDYVHNPILNQWMYAKDAQELTATFAARNPNRSSAASNSCGLAVVLFIVAAILGWANISYISQAFAGLLGTTAFIFGVIGVVLYFLKK